MKTTAVLFTLISTFMLTSSTTAQQSRTLDWSARLRMVHFDRVDSARIEVFEGARRAWLASLSSTGGYVADGRPLFWSGMHRDAVIYLTFYPFVRWSDLDDRLAAMDSADRAAGAAAVDAYDAGDAPLLPPHWSEIWRRFPSMDIETATELDELTAEHARVEFRQMPTGDGGAGADSAWQALQAYCAGSFTCRVFGSVYGSGQVVLLWLSSEEKSISDEGDWRALLRREATGRQLLERIESLMPLEESIVLRRRDDLSHLPPETMLRRR